MAFQSKKQEKYLWANNPNGKRLTFKDLLDDKTIEFTLTVTNHHPDAEDNKEYAFVKNYKLDEVNDMGRKVPQKYIKEFNNLI